MSLANVAQGNAFYINVAAVKNLNILTATGAAATNVPVAVAALDATTGVLAGGLVVRDLGKTVRFPGSAGGGVLQQVLRKVELIDTGALTPLVDGLPASFVNFNEGSGNTARNVFYIAVKPNATNAVVFAKLGL
jgi:hypothetical protein